MRNVKAKHILVMRGGALGDFVLTLPALAALRAHFPTARIEVLGYPRIAELARAGGLADAVSSIEAPELARLFAPDAQVTKRFAEFDLMVSYLFDPERGFEANARRSAPEAVFVRGPHRPDEAGGVHATAQLLAPLRELGISEADPEPRLSLGGGEGARSGELAMHPGSGSERKNWPEDKWAELIARVALRRKCLLVGGEAEGAKLERLKIAGVEVAQNWPLVDLAKRLQKCGGLVGHDSGVTHLAAAVGLPGLALWGETNEAVWRPLSARMKLLRHADGLSRLPVEDVFGKLAQLALI